MEIKGTIWPSELDMQAKTIRYHIALTQPEDEPYRFDVGTVAHTVTESPEGVQARLERDFPLYRIVQAGKRLLHLTGGSVSEI